MKKQQKIIYQIKDNYADAKAKYGELLMFSMLEDTAPKNAKKFIDTNKPYYNSYYYSDEQKWKEKENELYLYYKTKLGE